MAASDFPGFPGFRLNGTIVQYWGASNQDKANNRTLVRITTWMDKSNINNTAYSLDASTTAQLYAYRRNNADAWELVYSDSIAFGWDFRPAGQQVNKWLWAFDLWIYHKTNTTGAATFDHYVQAPILGSTSVHDTINLATLGALPGAPTAPTISEGGSTSFEYRATNPVGVSPAITAREVQVSTVSNFTSGVTSFSPATLTRVNITGRTASTSYWIRSRVQNSFGWGPWSAVIQYTTLGVPGAPTITGITPDLTSVEYTIVAPAYTGGGILEYETQLLRFIDLVPVDSESGNTTTAREFTGIDQGEVFMLSVRARGSAGWGAWSDPYTFRTLGAPLSVQIFNGTDFERAGAWVYDGLQWKPASLHRFDGAVWRRGRAGV